MLKEIISIVRNEKIFQKCVKKNTKKLQKIYCENKNIML